MGLFFWTAETLAFVEGLVKMLAMPPEPTQQQRSAKTLQQLVDEVGLYPAEAYQFVQEGLSHTVGHIHGKQGEGKLSRHVSGPQLCEGLRELAIAHWGRLARTVLRRWNVTGTYDFGRIVFAMIDAGQMQKSDEDSLEDFRNVFDFKTALESDYRIPLTSPALAPGDRP